MNILIYTFHYPFPKNVDLVPDTKVIQYFANELMRKGHRVQVVHLHYYPVKEISLKHLRYILPQEKKYEIDGVPVRLYLYQMLTPHRFYPEKFQAGVINRRLRKMKKENGWKADKVFVHFPTTFTGLTEIFTDTDATLGDFHNIDVWLLKENDPRGEALAFIKRLRTKGYRNKRVHERLRELCGEEPVPVYTGIDRELLATPEWIDEKKQNRSSVLRVLYAGQLIPLKNVDILIEAFKMLSVPAELTIVGDGSEMPKLRELAGERDDIVFTGWLEREKALEKMNTADVFVMVSSPETYGMVYLEAMARGCINVASRGEGFDGLIRDGENGFLLTPRNADQIRELLERISTMPDDERNRLIDAGYAMACAMTEDQTTQGFLDAAGE